MSNTNNDLDNFQVFESNIDYGQVPESIPFDQSSIDAYGLTDEETRDLNVLDVFTNLNVDELGDPPDHLLSSPITPDEEEPLTPIQQFLVQKMEAFNSEEISKDPRKVDKGLETPVPKYTQTNWFAEFNQQMRANDNAESILLSKLNGYFYTGEDTPEKALSEFGIEADKAKDFAEHFQMSYFGNTRPRTKNNNKNENGFKSFVLQLKNPKDPASQAILKEVEAAKRAAVMAKIEKSYDLQKATDHLVAKAPSIIAEEVAKSGVQPFVGSPEQLFLNPSAVRSELNDKIPEIDGLYNIEPLEIKGNKATYTGYSESLDSYFEDELKICKLTAKDPNRLSQEELEKIVSERLSFDIGHLAAVPEQAFVQQMDGVDPKPENDQEKVKDNTAENNEPGEKPFKSPKNKEYDKDDPDERPFNRRKQSEKPEEQSSLAKAALDAATKITEATLTAILALAKLIAQMIMKLIQAVLGINGNHNTFSGNLADTPWAQFTNSLKKIGMNKRFVDELENTKDISPEDQAKDLTDALDGELGAEKALGADLKSELQLADVKPLDKVALSKDELAKLNKDVLQRLDQDADNLLSAMSEDDKKAYLDKITVPALHKFDDKLSAKLSDPLHLDMRHGVLLARNDRVDYEGATMGVLAAYDVGGKLYYALANENDQGEYDVKVAEASALTLQEHNAFKFDNLENLTNQVNKIIADGLGVDADKVESISILDRNNLTGEEISIAELYTKTDFIKPEQLGLDTSSVSVEDLLKNNKEYESDLYFSLPQLHHDKTGDLQNTGKDNAHGFYGRLLDINDQVECILPNSSVPLKGAIAGAYSADSDLYYQIYHDNQFYSIKADEITLLQRNGGELTGEQIKLLKDDKSPEAELFKKGSIAAIHERSAVPVQLLAQNDENGFAKSYQSIFDNSIIKQGYSNIGVQPLVMDDNGNPSGVGRLISMKQYSGDKTVYVSLGETIDPENGAKKVVAVEVNNTLGGIKPLSAAHNKFVQLNMDDPDIKIEAAGFTNQNLKSFIDKAREIYEKGAFRRQATIASHYMNEASHAFAQGNESKEIAKEYYLQNKVALGLLEQEAQKINAEPQVELGANANLANMTVDSSNIKQVLDKPESRQAVPSQQKIDNNSVDLVGMSFAAVSLAGNAAVLNADVNEMIDKVAYNNLGKSFIVPNLSQVDLNNNPFANLAIDNDLVAEPIEPQVVEVVAQAPQEQVLAAPTRSVEDLVGEFQNLPEDSPIYKLADFALSYTAGKALLNNQSESLGFLSEKDTLGKRYEKLDGLVNELKNELSESISNSSLSQDNVNQIGLLNQALVNDGGKSFSLDCLIDDRIDIKVEQREHLDSFVNKLSELSSNINPADLSETEAQLLSDIKESVTKSIEEQNAKFEPMDRLIYTMDQARAAGQNPEEEYVTKRVNDLLAKDSEKLSSQINTISEAFSPKTPQKSVQLEQRNEHEFSNGM